MTQENIHEKYMQRCIQLAKKGIYKARPNPIVGAVIVYNNTIIGEGYHEKYGFAHAEVNAFESVFSENKKHLPQSTLYVTLEPCSHFGKTPPCCDLIISKKVKNVIVGCVDYSAKVNGKGIKQLRDADINVIVGVLEDKCKQLNKPFFTSNLKKRPYITIKWAQSINHYIDNEFKPFAFSSTYTRMLVHKLRAINQAILVGRKTMEVDKPLLDVRYWNGESPQKYVFSQTTPHKLLNELNEKGIQSLLIEGGAKTIKAFIEANLWDEIQVETTQHVISNGTKAPEIPYNAKIVSTQFFDNNIIIHYKNDSEN